MYDTETRVCLVKQRVAEKRRRQEWRGIYRLSALCMTLFLSLVRMVGAVQGQPMTLRGCTVRSCCMRAQAAMCWRESFPLPRRS